MRIRQGILALAVGLLPVGMAVSGCGAERAATHTAGVDTAQAAQTTAAKRTAKVQMTIRASGGILPKPVVIRAHGIAALDQPRFTATMDFGDLLGAFGAISGSGDVQLRVTGADAYVKPPALPGLSVPGGKHWIHADVRGLAHALGIDPGGLSTAFTVLPSSQLAMLHVAHLHARGRTTTDGLSTTHYAGTLRPTDAMKAVSAQRRKMLQSVLDQLRTLPGVGAQELDQPIPTELWIGDDGSVRRLRFTQKATGSKVAAPSSMVVDEQLSDFGTPLDVPPPDATDTWEATQTLTRLLKQGVEGLTSGAAPNLAG